MNGASKIVNNDAAKILAAVSPDKLDDGKAALKAQDELEAFKVVVAQKDKQEVPLSQQRVLQLVGRIEEDMVKGFPLRCRRRTTPRPCSRVAPRSRWR